MITFAAMTILMLSELFHYVFPLVRQHYVVDPTIGAYVPLSLDIWVATPCDQLVIVLSEPSSDTRFLNGDLSQDDEYMEGDMFPDSFIRKVRNAISGMEGGFAAVTGCRIRGTIKVMKGAGKLAILPLGVALGPLGAIFMAQQSSINFSHQIKEFSFAPLHHQTFLSTFGQGLKGSEQVAIKSKEHFTYFLSVIPTILLDNSPPLFTNKYVIKGFESMSGFQDSLQAGLFFSYDHEPLALVVDRPRISFRKFLVHLVGILGGIFACSSIFYRLVQWVYIKCSSHTSSSAMLLD